MRESSVEITQIWPCKKLQNFQKSGSDAPRTKKLHALVNRELCIPHNIAESQSSQYCIQIRTKTNVQRRESRDHTNFARNSRKRIAKFPKIFGTLRKEELHKLGRRDCTNCRTSLQLSFESMCVLRQDHSRVQRRDHAKLAQKSGKKLQNFQKSGTPRAQRIACTRPACAAHTSQRRW